MYLCTYSSGMKSGLTRKDEMYNELVDLCEKRSWVFPKDGANTEGTLFVKVCIHHQKS